MRAVVDTNVLISALLNPRGAPARVLSAALRSEYDLVTSSELLAELAEVLQRKIRGLPSGRRERFLTLIRRRADVVDSVGIVAGIAADPDDTPVLEAAFSARASVIVTGDRQHLLPLKRVAGIRIVSPREFLDLLKRSRHT